MGTVYLCGDLEDESSINRVNRKAKDEGPGTTSEDPGYPGHQLLQQIDPTSCWEKTVKAGINFRESLHSKSFFPERIVGGRISRTIGAAVKKF